MYEELTFVERENERGQTELFAVHKDGSETLFAVDGKIVIVEQSAGADWSIIVRNELADPRLKQPGEGRQNRPL